MYCKILVFSAVALYVVVALPQHDSHSVRAHNVVHPVYEYEHHDAHHSGKQEQTGGHHAPAVSSQSLFIHHSGGHQTGGHGDSGHHGHEEEHHGHPKYVFEYKVEDPHTGDNKYQKESRDGDKVEGVYHFVEADGRLRTVKYHADKHSGFNAEVTHSGHAVHVEQPKHHHH